MHEHQTLLTRIGNWFRRSGPAAGESYYGDGASGDRASLLSDGNGHGDSTVGGPGSNTSIETRTSFLRPWARRDAAIQHLQDGFHTLTDLMTTVRSNLEQQNKRQDELITYLSHLPQAIQALPEAQRIQSEALAAIHHQLAAQNGQQERLATILEKLNTKGLENGEVLDEVRQRVESMRQTDAAIAENLSSVGTAMNQLSRTEQTTSQVLEQMRDNLDARDGQLERVLHRQGTRFTTMLAIAIFLSISALAAVCVFGYLLLNGRIIHQAG